MIIEHKTSFDKLSLTRFYLFQSWGGKENGFGLADCCDLGKPPPPSGTTLHFEFHSDTGSGENKDKDAAAPAATTSTAKETKDPKDKTKNNMTYIHVEHVDQIRKSPAEIMKGLLAIYNIPTDKEVRIKYKTLLIKKS